MTLFKAVEIVTEHQKWRRGEPPYDGILPHDLPHSPAEIGIAIDCLLSISRDVIKNHKANE